MWDPQLPLIFLDIFYFIFIFILFRNVHRNGLTRETTIRHISCLRMAVTRDMSEGTSHTDTTCLVG